MKANNLERFMSEDRAKILRQLREWKSYANTDDMKEFVEEIIGELCEGNNETSWLPISFLKSSPLRGVLFWRARDGKMTLSPSLGQHTQAYDFFRELPSPPQVI
jgi:hypothetical protein